MGTPCYYPTLHIPPMVPPVACHHTQQQLDLSPSNHPPTIMVHVRHSTSTCYSPSICYSPTPPSSPSQVEDTRIFEAILIHTMAGPYCHAATVTIFHSQITLTAGADLGGGGGHVPPPARRIGRHPPPPPAHLIIH